MKRTLLPAAAAIIICSLAVVPANAQFEVGPLAGINFDGTEILAGAQARFPVGAEIAGLPIIAKPGIEFYPFIEPSGLGSTVDFSLFVVNLDAIVPLDISESFQGYGGAGLYIARTSVDFNVDVPGFDIDGSSTDLGLNIVAGANFGNASSTLVPFVEAVLALGDGSSGLLAKGGILLSIGGD